MGTKCASFFFYKNYSKGQWEPNAPHFSSPQQQYIVLPPFAVCSIASSGIIQQQLKFVHHCKSKEIKDDVVLLLVHSFIRREVKKYFKQSFLKQIYDDDWCIVSAQCVVLLALQIVAIQNTIYSPQHAHTFMYVKQIPFYSPFHCNTRYPKHDIFTVARTHLYKCQAMPHCLSLPFPL